jgi:zinc protease
MAFNGTENFKGKGILNTLQKQGIVFGKDINAYTSFDETVYNIDNIPTTPELLDTGLLIIRDWSNYLLLTDEEIDAERGVIKEEWRTRQNGSMRVLKQSLPILFNNTIYAKRLPIGSMDVVANFDYKVLRDFYHDWYRSDLQAIAIVGDIDVQDMEQKIKTMFSSIPAVTIPKVRETISIPENDQMLYALAMDEEVTTANITFGIRHKNPLEDETVKDLYDALVHNMITDMLSSRIDEISKKPEASFLGVRVNYGNHSRVTDELSLKIYPKQGQQQEAFKAAMTELNRAVKFGFTDPEIQRTMAKFKTYYEKAISKLDDQSHKEIIRTIQNNYLQNETMTDVVKEYELAKQMFDQMTPGDILNVTKKLYTDKNRYLVVTGVKGQNNLTELEAMDIINQIENDNTLQPYRDALDGKSLLSDIEFKKGSVISEYTLQSLNATTLTLSNGIKVHYKFTDKQKNDVQLYALSDGGLSLVEDKDLPSADMVRNTVNFSGLGDYSSSDLDKILAGKSARTQVSISNLNESINGSSTTKDVETMLQMVYLRFVKPRFEEDAFNVLMQNVDDYLVRKSNNINQKVSDSTTVALYGYNNAKKRLFDDAYAKDINFNTVKRIYKERFNNPADFEFFIVGDVNIEDLRSLLENYLASIPTSNNLEDWKDNSVSWQKPNIDRDFTLVMEDPKSSVKIGYRNSIPYSLKNEYVVRTIGDILKLRYTETLREEEGGTYGASASANMSKRPVAQANINISFDCNPEKVETLVSIVHNEIQKLANGDIQKEDLNKTLSNYIKERKEEQDFNRADMHLLTDYFLEGYNRNDPKNFEDIINNITIYDIQDITSKILNDAETYEIVFKPDQASKK